jgi:hypothetical protein
MRLTHLYAFKTKVGIFYISQSEDGRFHPFFDGESLGSYHSPTAAVQDLAGGHTFSVARVKDTSELDIPYDLVEWDKLR